jgi:hypothetical protein
MQWKKFGTKGCRKSVVSVLSNGKHLGDANDASTSLVCNARNCIVFGPRLETLMLKPEAVPRQRAKLFMDEDPLHQPRAIKFALAVDAKR